MRMTMEVCGSKKRFDVPSPFHGNFTLMGYAFIIWMWPQQLVIVVVCWLWFLFSRIVFYVHVSSSVCVVCTRQSWFTWCDDADVRQSKRSKRISQYRNVLRFKFEGKKKQIQSTEKNAFVVMTQRWCAWRVFYLIFERYWHSFWSFPFFYTSFLCVCVALPHWQSFSIAIAKKIAHEKKKGKRFESLPSVGWTSNDCLERKKRWNAVAPMMGGHRNAINIRSIILFFSFQVDKFKF